MSVPILRDFPNQFETDRLLIRAPRPGDGAAVNEAIVESFDRLRPWMPWAAEMPTPAKTEEFVRHGAANFVARTDLPLLLWSRASGEFVGGSGLHRIDWDNGCFETGYWCRTRREGQGFVSEAVRGIARFAFETLNAQRLEIRCDQNNMRSSRVAQRCGFLLEGTFRNHMRANDGTLRTTLVYAMIPEDFQRLGSNNGAMQGMGQSK